MEEILCPLLAAAGICGSVGAVLGDMTGTDSSWRLFGGFVLGALGGPVGWVVIATLPLSPEKEAERRRDIARCVAELAEKDAAKTGPAALADASRRERVGGDWDEDKRDFVVWRRDEQKRREERARQAALDEMQQRRG